MNKVFQLWGIPPAAGLDPARVLRVLERVLACRPLAVVAGQTEDEALLQEICRRAHAQGVKVHQWASLFSENDDAYPWDPLIGADGQPHPKRADGHFHFRCPASPRNVERFIHQQKKAAEGIPFDGVFLDRVRYPWLTSGPLACFCPDCLKRYEAAGIDACRVARMKDFSITGFEGDRPLFASPEAEAFFALRAQAITRAALRVKESFTEISLDFFPPALAYLVGQDLRALAPEALFLKPMLYRFTAAPAGLPYEMALSPVILDAAQQAAQYESVWPDLYWGIEGGFIPGVVEMTPGRIRESLGLIHGGVCASWAAIFFPEENLEVFLDA